LSSVPTSSLHLGLRPIVRRLEADYKCCHQLQEVAAYYFTWRAAAKQAYPDPKVPAIYHDFLAERETWTHFCKSILKAKGLEDMELIVQVPKDNFPGKDPLFDCLMSALCKEKVPDEYIKKEDDTAEWKISKLQEIIQQKDLLIQSKDELLEVRAEALRAGKELLAEKDKIIKVWTSSSRCVHWQHRVPHLPGHSTILFLD